MIRYIIGRLVTMVVVAWVIVTLTFFMLRALPGGPFLSDKNLPETIMRNLEARYGLNKPPHEQYITYLKGIATGDLGPSFVREGLTVNEIISNGLPVSATLGLISLLVSLGLGIPMGVASALRHNGVMDRVTQAAAVLTAAVPSFVIAALLQYVLGMKLRWLPVATWGGLEHMILPIVVLCSYSLALTVKMTRSAMLEVVGQDYIRTARAKGIPGVLVIYRHALRNAVVPIIAWLAPLTAGILVGSFIVEQMFAIPGIGREFVQSISNRDYTVTLGMTLFFGLLLMVFTLLGDICTALADPRVRLGREV